MPRSRRTASRPPARTPRREPTPIAAIAERVLSLPTGSFHEGRVLGAIRDFADERELAYEEDRAGNAYVTYRKGRARRPLVLSAHTDHPGFVVSEVRGKRLTLEFQGGLSAEYGTGEVVRLYGDGRSTARITSIESRATPGGRSARRITGAKAELVGSGATAPGELALWDVEPFRLRGEIVHARSCDDVAGCATVLGALDRAAASGANGHLVGLFTRAEEVGLLGAAAAAQAGRIPEGALVIAVETSSMAGGRAEQGAGPIVRVGDLQHVFNSRVTLWMTAVARELAAADPGFRFQRKLMDGGTTEATAFDLLGHETGAACIALGNYHNAGPRERVRAETVHLGDMEGMVRLFVALLEAIPRYDRIVGDARKRWERIGKDAVRRLAAAGERRA